MQSEFLQKLIGIVEKTGDKMVVTDPATGKPYVLMDLASYERLLAGPQMQFPQPASQEVVQMPVFLQPAPYAAPTAPAPQSIPEQLFYAQQSKKMAKSPTQRPSASGDLTQEELLDKINRDIGDWKTAQERKRTEVLQSAADRPPFAPNGATGDKPPFAKASGGQPPFAKATGDKPAQQQTFDGQALEEEERFYLEPIE